MSISMRRAVTACCKENSGICRTPGFASLISFVTAPLTEEIVREGKMEAELPCRSTVPHTCFHLGLDLVCEISLAGKETDILSIKIAIFKKYESSSCQNAYIGIVYNRKLVQRRES